MWQRVNSYASIGQAIQVPFTFYYIRNDDWCNTHSYQFWNKNSTTAVGINNETIVKTIYSPSPSGYIEPKTAAFTGFTSTGSNTTNGGQFNVSGSINKGWSFYTNGWKTGGIIFFPILGFRDVIGYRQATGNIIEVGSAGVFWTVGASSTLNARDMHIGYDAVYPQYEGARSFGFTYRPVKE